MMLSQCVLNLPVLLQVEMVRQGSWAAFEALTEARADGPDAIFDGLKKCAGDASLSRNLPEIITGVAKAGLRNRKRGKAAGLGLIRFSKERPEYISVALPGMMAITQKGMAQKNGLDSDVPASLAELVCDRAMQNPFVFAPYVDDLCRLAQFLKEPSLRLTLGLWVATCVPFANEIKLLIPDAEEVYLDQQKKNHPLSTFRQTTQAIADGASPEDVFLHIYSQQHHNAILVFLGLMYALPRPDESFILSMLDACFRKTTNIPFEALPMVASHYANLRGPILERVSASFNDHPDGAESVWTDGVYHREGSRDIWMAILADNLLEYGSQGVKDFTPYHLYSLGRKTRGAGRTEMISHRGHGRETRDAKYSPVTAVKVPLQEVRHAEMSITIRRKQ